MKKKSKKNRLKRIFPSAKQDKKFAEEVEQTPQTLSHSYQLAYTDQRFLLRDELRPSRLQLEYLKTDLLLREHGINSTVVVFGSARPAAQKGAGAGTINNSAYHKEARRFAKLISQRFQGKHTKEYVITTGGGPGIMEAANRGAADAEGISIGLNVVLPYEQAPNPYITPELCFQFHYFAIRKMHFLLRARALVIFPGGFGTLDELFETLTLIQTKKIRPIPVLLFGEQYWKRIINFEAVAQEGMIDPDDLKLFQYVETAEECLETIEKFYAESSKR